MYYDGKNAEATARIELGSSIQPKPLTYKIVNTFPHDTLAFTEGLEFYQDFLYESTGQKKDSYFRKIATPEQMFKNFLKQILPSNNIFITFYKKDYPPRKIFFEFSKKEK